MLWKRLKAMVWAVQRCGMLHGLLFWRRFINADEANKLQTIVNKAKRSNFLPSDFSAFEELFDSADFALFRTVLTAPDHVLHPLLPPRKKTGYNLRKRSHGLMLAEAKSSFLRNNFLVRMLYTDVYWHSSLFTLYRHCICQWRSIRNWWWGVLQSLAAIAPPPLPHPKHHPQCCPPCPTWRDWSIAATRTSFTISSSDGCLHVSAQLVVLERSDYHASGV